MRGANDSINTTATTRRRQRWRRKRQGHSRRRCCDDGGAAAPAVATRTAVVLIVLSACHGSSSVVSSHDWILTEEEKHPHRHPPVLSGEGTTIPDPRSIAILAEDDVPRLTPLDMAGSISSSQPQQQQQHDMVDLQYVERSGINEYDEEGQRWSQLVPREEFRFRDIFHNLGHGGGGGHEVNNGGVLTVVTPKDWTDDPCSRDELFLASRGKSAGQGGGGSGAWSKLYHDPLACWLWRLKVKVPDQSFKEGLITVATHGMTCSNFVVQSVKSSYVPPTSSKDSGGAIKMEIKGIAATCQGQYQASLASGTVTASVQDSNIGLTIHVIPDDKHYMAQRAVVVGCDANLQVPPGSLHFSGSASAWFVNLFSRPIGGYVTKALSTQTCPALKEQVESQTVETLKKVNDDIRKLIHGGKPAESDPVVPSQYRARTLDWTIDVPFLRSYLVTLNSFIRSQLALGVHCGIDKALHLFTNGTGVVSINIPPKYKPMVSANVTIPQYGRLEVSLNQVNVSGVDTLDHLEVFNPDGHRGMTSAIASTSGFNVSASIDLAIHLNNEGGNVEGGDVLRETFDVTIGTSGTNMSSRILVGMDRETFDVLTMEVIWPCLARTVYLANFTDVSTDVDVSSVNIAPRKSTLSPHHTSSAAGPLEDALDKLIDDVLDLFVHEYRPLVTDGVYAIFQGVVRPQLNAALEEFISHHPPLTLEEEEDDVVVALDAARILGGEIPHDDDVQKHHHRKTCAPVERNGTDYIRFDESLAIQTIDSFINGPRGVETVNGMIDCVVNAVADDDGRVPGIIFEKEYGGMRFTLRDLMLSNLGATSEVVVVKPEIDHYHLMNEIAISKCNIGHNGTCNLPTVAIVAEAEHPASGLRGDARFTLSLGNISGRAGVQVKFNMNEFLAMNINRYLSQPECQASAYSEFQLYGVHGELDTIKFAVNGSLTRPNEDPKNGSLTMGGIEAVKMVNEALSSAAPLLEKSFNGMSQLFLFQSPYLCRNEPVPTGDTNGAGHSTSHSGGWVFWNSFLFASILGIAAFLSVMTCCRRRRLYQSQRSFDRSDTRDGFFEEARLPLLPREGDDITTPTRLEGESTTSEKDDAEEDQPLMLHGSVPSSVRYTIPVLLICTMALFLSSNVSTGATVDPVVTKADGSKMHLPPAFAFSLGNTVAEMYHAGVYALMLLILVFSGIWPYVKLALMLFAWVVPPVSLSPHKREKLLLWLDTLGKYSLVDTFVLVLLMVAFRFHVDMGEYALDIYITPTYGFYGFLLATIASLILGHVVLFFHRKSEATKKFPRSGLKESLRRHRFYTMAAGRGSALLTWPLQVLLAVILLASFALLLSGIWMKSFHFTIEGLSGWLLGDERLKSYSFVSLGQAIPSGVEDPSTFPIRMFRFFYFYFGIAMPITSLSALTVLFFLPLKGRLQDWVYVVAEVSNAWSAMEVFVISIVAALVAISRFASSIIGHRCDSINRFLKSWFDEEMKGEDVCFDVNATISGDAWFLFSGTALWCIVSFILLRLAEQALEERLHREGVPLCVSTHGGGEAETNEGLIMDDPVFVDSVNRCFCGRALVHLEGYTEVPGGAGMDVDGDLSEVEMEGDRNSLT